MATRQLSSKARQTPNRPGDARNKPKPAGPAQCVYADSVPEWLHEAIEIERDNLAKAESVLGCLVLSMEYESDTVSGPYYPDVARIARELIRQAINGLDPLTLQKRLFHNKIKEEASLCAYCHSSTNYVACTLYCHGAAHCRSAASMSADSHGVH